MQPGTRLDPSSYRWLWGEDPAGTHLGNCSGYRAPDVCSRPQPPMTTPPSWPFLLKTLLPSPHSLHSCWGLCPRHGPWVLSCLTAPVTAPTQQVTPTLLFRGDCLVVSGRPTPHGLCEDPGCAA